MTQKYIGCKQVTAWPEQKEGKDGYAVKYQDGYTSWSPKEVFEQFYLPMGEEVDGTRITERMVDDFIEAGTVSIVKVGLKTTVVHLILPNGFIMVESSSSVSPANYDEGIGTKICMDRLRSKVWELLGFMLQSAIFGVSRNFVNNVGGCPHSSCYMLLHSLMRT